MAHVAEALKNTERTPQLEKGLDQLTAEAESLLGRADTSERGRDRARDADAPERRAHRGGSWARRCAASTAAPAKGSAAERSRLR